MTISYTKDELQGLLLDLVQTNHFKTGIIYLQISRGIQSPRNHIFLGQPSLESVLTASTLTYEIDFDGLKSGGSAITIEDPRWLHCDIKSLNLLGNVLANNKAYAAGAQEAIFHRKDIVTECSHSNVFIVKDGALITHPANHLILNGITRQIILELAHSVGLPVEERSFTLTELVMADEVFYSNVASEAYPLIKINDHLIGNGTRGNITKRIQELFFKKIQIDLEETIQVE